MRFALLSIVAVMLLAAGSPAHGQFEKETSSAGVQFDKTQTQRWKVGMIVRAVGGPCRGLAGTVPVPIVWPEQQVKVIDEEISPAVRRVRYRTIAGGVKQMVIIIPILRSGQTAKALVTLEIERRSILAPSDPSIFVLPEKVDSSVRRYLGASPYIESRHPKIRSLAREIVNEDDSAWKQVETIYDWVRDNVEYKNGKLKGALAALRDGTGDCEELTSLFVALCRARKIPARTVWVPDHCYPEFYLHDDQGMGHWIPCQAAGSRAFGEMPELRPILQKGDNFKVPEKSKPQRYVAEFLKGSTTPGGGRPQVEFIRQNMPVP